jgi:hypothetical protein
VSSLQRQRRGADEIQGDLNVSTSFANLPTTLPDWVVSLMPAGYENRLAEIQRLAAELRTMDRFGALLLDVGSPLESAVRDLFAAMKFEVDAAAAPGSCQLGVKLDAKRRLLVHVAETRGTIAKQDPALERVFQMLTRMAGSTDRVILVAAGDTSLPPAERPDPVAQEAIDLLERLGVNVASSSTLFTLWSMSLQDVQRARSYVDKMHAQNGGLCPAPTPAPRV